MAIKSSGAVNPRDETDLFEAGRFRESFDSKQWIADFRRKNGRPLRVLHIGNIANNAYMNAKIQRARGIEADVLSFGYYHIMGCPEWEDAEFEGVHGDDMMPDWWGVRFTKPYKRPRWFAQGSLDLCIRMLMASRGKSQWARRATWYGLEFERWVLSRQSFPARVVRAIIMKICGRPAGLNNAQPTMLLAQKGAKALTDWMVKHPKRATPKLRQLQRRMALYGQRGDANVEAPLHLKNNRKARSRIEARANEILGETGREMQPHDMDHVYIWWWHPYLPKLFRQYDIVQCYATYGAMPMAIELPHYVTYEHGTIRTIPYDDDAQGRLCMASYRGADAVLVTNTDCLDSAVRMGVDLDRIVPLPHAFDSDKIEAFARAHAHAKPPTDVVSFFAPARHHWVDNNIKANDRIFRALSILKAEGLTCRLRVVDWGKDVQASKALIAQLGLTEQVEWVPVMKKKQLWEEYLRSHAVLDQFLLPAMGAVGFETMLLGRLLIASIDKPTFTTFFVEPPPVPDVRTIEQIAATMREVIRNPQGALETGAKAREWMRKYHSSDQIVALQAQSYAAIVAARESERAQPSRVSA